MTRDGIRFHKNLTERDPCPICHDDGMVELQGTETIHGYQYSRGSAPCHWCESGAKAYTAHRTRGKAKNGLSNYPLASDYTITDVAGYEPNPEYPTKQEASAYLKAILPTLGQP